MDFGECGLFRCAFFITFDSFDVIFIAEFIALIQVKLHRPKIPIDLVPRPRLIAWLDERRQRSLTLGFGNAASRCGSSLTVLFKKNLDPLKIVRHRIKKPIWCVFLPVINLYNVNEPFQPMDTGLADLSFSG